MITRRGLGDVTSGIADAIARMEGFYVAGSISARNNNPGNLRNGPGQVGTSGGFAVFPDQATGWAALQRQVDVNVSRGLNLYEFFGGGNGYAGYAPSADSNNPTAYADFVAQQTGIDPNAALNSLIGETPSDPTSNGFDTAASVDGGNSVLPMVALVGLGLLVAWRAFA